MTRAKTVTVKLIRPDPNPDGRVQVDFVVKFRFRTFRAAGRLALKMRNFFLHTTYRVEVWQDHCLYADVDRWYVMAQGMYDQAEEVPGD